MRDPIRETVKAYDEGDDLYHDKYHEYTGMRRIQNKFLNFLLKNTEFA